MTNQFFENPGDKKFPENLNPQDLVEVKFRGETPLSILQPNATYVNTDIAENWYWLHEDHYSDIVQYRIVEKQDG